MREMWRRRVALGGAVVVGGVLIAISTVGCAGFRECTWTDLPLFPGTETQRVVGIFAVAVGGVVLTWAVRGYRRNDPVDK
jgi:hypothetical protein